GQILVDVPTCERIADFAYCTPALPLYGKGMLKPVKVFEVVGIAGSVEEKSGAIPLEASYGQSV
ncbi:MAG TPA: hypothetical protein PLJ24_05335, partial [Anaerolineae bacterium]|nr:hypothetical protein [Anaerolineae bacterium]